MARGGPAGRPDRSGRGGDLGVGGRRADLDRAARHAWSACSPWPARCWRPRTGWRTAPDGGRSRLRFGQRLRHRPASRQSRAGGHPDHRPVRPSLRRRARGVQRGTSQSGARSAPRSASSIDGVRWSTWPAVAPMQAASAPWSPDTLVDYYSAGKPFLALLALQLVDAGLIAPRRPPRRGVARVRGRRQGSGHLAPCPVPPRGCAGHRRAADQRGPVGLGTDDRSPGRHPALVGAGYPSRVPHQYVRPSHRRGGAAGEWRRRCRERLAEMAASLGADIHIGVPRAERHRCADDRLRLAGSVRPRLRRADRGRPHGDVELLQSSRLLLHGCRQHGRVARRRGAVDERSRNGARPGTLLRRPPRAGTAALGRSAGRGYPHRSRRAIARSSTRRWRSASASSRRCHVAPSARTRTVSGTSVPAARSASPIPKPAWPLGTS